MLHFCTLFDSNYLSRGLALHESLVRNVNRFHLYIFAFDDRSQAILKQLNLEHTTLIPLGEFEDASLLAVKPTRSKAEYCWTCTPSTIRYVINRFGVDHCTYIDADMYFYTDPGALIEEMGTDSVLITPHYYTSKYAYFANTSGVYCVQFVTFRNDDKGMHVLNWWANACIEWCYARFEDGKFGDQKYLDQWTATFQGVHVLQHRGGGVAPWNAEQYAFRTENGKPFARLTETGRDYPVIFFHFHGVKFFSNASVDLSSTYYINRNTVEHVYFPYLEALERAKKRVQTIDSTYDPHGTSPYTQAWKLPLRYLKRKFNHTYNIYYR
jgi:hypothetical protein